MTPLYILKISCPAASGIVAAITGFLAKHDCYITEMAQYDDEDSQVFFMRAVFRFNQIHPENMDAFRQAFNTLAEHKQMSWHLLDTSIPTRVILMVSKADHCFNDLLYRFQKGELHMQVVAVVSNHLDMQNAAERLGLPYVHVPVTKDTKPQQEQAIWQLIQDTKAELVILARYMQILSNDLCEKLSGMAINIHHSFLPGFKGARPYHQAYERGVKLIGATAHYVTCELDEGPIIEQAVQRVDHTYSPDALAIVGRDTESAALSKAVQYHLEHRVFLDGNKTVVFK